MRLSLVYALLDGVAYIDEPHLRAALAVWDYCDQSAKMLFDSPDTLENKILDKVSESPGISKTDLRKEVSSNDSRSTKKFAEALSSLVKRGEVVVVPVMENRQVDRLYLGVRTLSSIGTPLSAAIESEPAPSVIPVVTQTDSPLPSLETTPTSLNELFMWRNANGVKFPQERGRNMLGDSRTRRQADSRDCCGNRSESDNRVLVRVRSSADSTTNNAE